MSELNTHCRTLALTESDHSRPGLSMGVGPETGTLRGDTAVGSDRRSFYEEQPETTGSAGTVMNEMPIANDAIGVLA